MRFLPVLRIAVCCLLALCCSFCRQEPLDHILSDGDAAIRDIVDRPDLYAVQIVYLRTHRDARGQASVEEFSFGMHPETTDRYSTLPGLPLAILALEKLHALGVHCDDPRLRMRFDSARPAQTRMLTDPGSPSGMPSPDHFIRVLLHNLDDNAFNRMYEFLGKDEIHSRLSGRGYQRTRIMRRSRLPEVSADDDRFTNPVSIYHNDTLLFAQPEQEGVADQGLSGPCADRSANCFPLMDQVRMLQTLMLPASVPDSNRFCLGTEEYSFLYRALHRSVADSASVLLAAGSLQDTTGQDIHVFHQRPGILRHLLTDCAYIADPGQGVEYILAASLVLLPEHQGSQHDSVFETRGRAFFRELGWLVYLDELTPIRKYQPEFSALQEFLGSDHE